ncbi:hypothetical protein FB45DRAFT_793935 [Roridomyces roridus]|uniref:Pentatricopeptide repeat protein n=1 Tax=Roridomyces roridus TaxID=1738132 RepID=A0AAD7BUN9_9AGAR|nr:hypothetical protein FB45DRAFT_793935 [Roridomyces roridus]
MLRRVAVALENYLPTRHFVPSFVPPPCPSTLSLHSLTCIRYIAVFSASHLVSDDPERVQNHLVASTNTAPKPVLPPARDRVRDLFLNVPHQAVIVQRIQGNLDLKNYMTDPQRLHPLVHDLASSRNPESALAAINVSRRLGCPVDMDVYETLAYRLGALKEWRLLLHVLRSAWRNTHQATPTLLNWRARALLEVRHFTDLSRIFDLFYANNLTPNRRTWHLVLSGHIRNNDLAGARDCMSRMEAAGFPADHATDALVGTLYRNIGPDEQVKERALASLPHIPPHLATATMNSLMQLRLRIHDLDEVFRLLLALDQNKAGPLAMMLAASRAQREGSQSLHMPYSLPLIIAPDATTYALFIDYFAELQELPTCLAILDHMFAAGIAATQRVLMSLIDAYFACGHGGAAVRLVACMCNPKTTPPRLFEKNLPSSEGYTLAFDPTGLGRPTRGVFYHLLRGVLGTNGLAGGRVVLQVMRANGIKPDAKTTQLVASHSNRIGRVDPQVLLRMMRRFSPHVTLEHAQVVISSTMRYQKFLVNGVGWNVVASKFSPTRAPRFKQFPAAALSDASTRVDPLVGLEVPRRHRATFRPLRSALRSKGIKSDKASFALRIRHDAVIRKDMESATQVFQTMLGRGLHPDKYHYSALMEGYANTGDLESAIEVMNSAARNSSQPSVVMFTILIVGYARRNEPDMALQVFRQMVAAGIKPDVPAIDAVTSAFFARGAYTMCWRVLTSLWQHISPLPDDIDKASLHSAAVYFRSLHVGKQGAGKTSKEFQTAMFKELDQLSDELRHWKRQHPAWYKKVLVRRKAFDKL